MEQQEQSRMLAVGTVAPNFRLASAQGKDIALEDSRGRKNVLVWFSRGLACPFCRRYMVQLRLGYQELQARNTDILQVTCSTPAEAQLYFRQYQLSFPYLCDPERAVFPLYGIRIARAAIGKFVANMGTSMAAMVSDRLLHGEKSPSPVPYLKRYGVTDMEQQAVFLIDTAGVIRSVYSSGSLGGLPASAEYVRQLDQLQ
jgi:putative peptide zinc metalloprotease protein